MNFPFPKALNATNVLTLLQYHIICIGQIWIALDYLSYLKMTFLNMSFLNMIY